MSTPLIEDSIEIDVSPERVWSIVADLRKMSEWSPQVRKVFVRDPVHIGTTTVTINRPNWRAWPQRIGTVAMWCSTVWPTRSEVVTLEVDKTTTAWRVRSNNTVWSYQIEPTGTGTRLIERRIADNITYFSKLLADRVLGGNETFEEDPRRNIRQSLERIKNAAEHG